MAHDRRPPTWAEVGVAADERWAELEAICRFPDDLYRALAQSDAFTVLVPTELGGLGWTPAEWFDAGIEFGRANGSLGWIATQGAAMTAVFTACGSPEVRAALLGTDGVRLAAVNTAAGRYRRVGDEVEVDGRWPFTSGCDGATWIGTLVLPDGSSDRADLRMAMLRAEDLGIEHDWDPIGLRGTGSHTVVATGVRCRADFLVPLLEASDLDHPIRVAAPRCGAWPIAGAVAATQLGIARRALDEAERIVDAKAPAPTFQPLRRSASAQRAISELSGAWWAARAGVRDAFGELWEQAPHGEPSMALRRQLAIVNQHANATAGRIVDDVWRLAGTSGIGHGDPLARCLRDSRPLLGHIAANERVLEYADQVRQTGEPLAFALV